VFNLQYVPCPAKKVVEVLKYETKPNAEAQTITKIATETVLLDKAHQSITYVQDSPSKSEPCT